MRGYHQIRNRLDETPRSIPADAGLPETSGAGAQAARVYPRGCGATPRASSSPRRTPGLSPRMRGYPSCRAICASCPRSIPADAGLPLNVAVQKRGDEVYPRGCGATDLSVSFVPTGRGLSPRMRGYLRANDTATVRDRSIPADAGLPIDFLFDLLLFAVYPRGCGATPATVCQDQGATGPSLRVSRRKRASLSQEDQCVAGYSAAYRVRSIGGIRGNRNVKEQTPPVTQSLPGTSSAAWARLRRSPAPPPLPAPGAPLRHGPP